MPTVNVPPDLVGRCDWTIHPRNEDRWSNASELQVVGRGQEFVADIGDRKQPRVWLMNVLEAIESPRSES